MNMIEKECPYCSGAIKFSIYDKTTKCEYCGKIIDVSKYNPKTEHVVENKYVDVNKKDFYTNRGRIGNTKELLKRIALIVVGIAIIVFIGVKAYQGFEKNSKYEEINSKTIDYNFLNKLHEASISEIKDKCPESYSIEGIDRYKTYAYNTKTTFSDGYSRDNKLYDIYKVTYSNGVDRRTVYQCVSHSEIVIIEGVTSFDETSPFYMLKNFSSGYLTNLDLKYYFDDSTYVYGAKTFEEVFEKSIPTKSNMPSWEFYSVVEIEE